MSKTSAQFHAKLKRSEAIKPAPALTTCGPSIDTSLCFKVIFLGDKGVGKTSTFLQSCGVGLEFGATLDTLGNSMREIEVQYNECLLTLKLWDSSSTNQYSSLANGYFKGSDGGFIIYDSCNKKTFSVVEDWFDLAKEYAPPHIRLILVGNKIDVENSRQVSKEQGENLALELGIPFIEISSKTKENLQDAFNLLADDLLFKGDGLKS